MNERSYLSIGDVLALLREEFPDITISKIRFLESRGLLIPERTPSGYRKFYDHDVDRLRWILRQQRENFLPLKVIKGRLEGQEPSSEPTPLFEVARSEEAPLEPVFATQPANGSRTLLEEAARHAASMRGGGSQVATLAGVSPGARVSTAGGPSAPRPPLVAPADLSGPAKSGDASQAVVEPPGGQPAAPRPLLGGDAPGGAAPVGRPLEAGAKAIEGGSGDAGARPQRTVTEVPAPEPPPAGDGPAAPAPQRSANSPVPPAPRTGGPGSHAKNEGHAQQTPAPHPEPALAGASLTAAELAHASGLDLHQVEELESYGLIESRIVAGVSCFDEDALVVAGLAAGFARFGVEARHLRMFKHAAERQTSMYSQIVMPLLRQRNPEARRRAHDDLTRLTELGASMQACFAKAVLRDLTRG